MDQTVHVVVLVLLMLFLLNLGLDQLIFKFLRELFLVLHFTKHEVDLFSLLTLKL